MMKKKTEGRKKIEIKKIENIDNRLVTFSKRRGGLFKKASELCVLTGAEIVILVQSHGGRVYAFGHPDVESVIDAYLGNNNVSNSNRLSDNGSAYMYEEYNKKYEEIAKEMKIEKNKSKNVEGSGGFWWENSFEDLEIDELEAFTESMEKLRINVTKKADELRNSGTSSSVHEIANENIVDGLLTDQVILYDTSSSLDEIANENIVSGSLVDQVILPNTSSSLNKITNENIVNGSLDDQVILPYTSSPLEEIANENIVDGSIDDQVILPDLDQFLPRYFGVPNEDLMMPAHIYGSSGFNNYSFENAEDFVLDNHDNEYYDGGNNLQVQSDLGTFGVPDNLYFRQDQI